MEKKISLSHLPDRAGVARSHFWEVLGGRKSPTLTWIAKVAGALDIDAGELLRNVETSPLLKNDLNV